MTGKTIVNVALVVLPLTLWAVVEVRVPVDAGALRQAETAAREAQQEGNSAATLRAYRRWMEFYPNEPAVRAGIYRAIAMLNAQDGDVDQANTWNAAASSLDPAPDQVVQAGASTTRGAADKLTAAFAAVVQAAQTMETVQAAFKAAHPPVAQATPMAAQPFPAMPVGSPGYQPQPGQPQPLPGYSAPPQPMQPQAFVQPAQPLQSLPQPVPLDAQGNPVTQPQPYAQTPGQPFAPQPQPIQPQPIPQAMPQPQPVQPQPIPQSMPQPQQAYAQTPAQPYAPQPQPVQPQPISQTMPQPQQAYAPQQQPAQPQPISQTMPQPQAYAQTPAQTNPSQAYARPAVQYQQQPMPGSQQRPIAARPAPYAAPAGYSRPVRTTRGEPSVPIRVFHDHSRLGDESYFASRCRALLLVEGGSLTFTASGGETAMVIPASEILEIRMNSAVGKEVGSFHIVTKKGLYLYLAPEAATAEEGRADVDALRKHLGLEQ